MLFLVCVNKWSVAAGISATPSRISLLLREVYTLIDMICLHELELNWTFSSKTHCCSRLVWPAKFDKSWRDNSNYLHSILSGLKKKLNESDLPFIALLIYAIWLSDHLTSWEPSVSSYFKWELLDNKLRFENSADHVQYYSSAAVALYSIVVEQH